VRYGTVRHCHAGGINSVKILYFKRFNVHISNFKITRNPKNTSFIKAKNVRHPLIETNNLNTTFIPNDIESGQFPLNSDSAKSKVKVITAPNASGKTIYLKQVGLLVYMSMIGSYVAADSAYVGDFDRILTRINSNDSIEYKLSTFAVDLNQITECVIDSTEKSLVIIDEFGKGTDPNDAQALIAAVIKFWINQENGPQVYLSTHFYEMFDFAERLFGEYNKKIEYLTLEYLIEDDDIDDSSGKKTNSTLNSIDYGKQKLIFMYKIKKGKTNSSFALNIARKGGLSETLVQRASEIRKILKENLQNGKTKDINELNKKLFDSFSIPEHKEILNE
jgi:DNA mismatch repair protein MSH5